MSSRDSSGSLFGAAGAGLPRPAAVCRALAAYLLITVFATAGAPVAFGQSPSPSPAEEGGVAGEKTDPTGGKRDQSAGQSGTPDDDKGKQKEEKRGSFVIAPIP